MLHNAIITLYAIFMFFTFPDSLIALNSIIMFFSLMYFCKYISKKNKIDYEEKINNYNNHNDDIIDPTDSFVIYLNGRNFDKLITKIDNKSVISELFKKTMISTSENLLNEFKCSTIYTYSDKIILIFNKLFDEEKDDLYDLFSTENPKKIHIFGGKRNKILSSIASFASVAFYKNLDHHNLDSMPIFNAEISIFKKTDDMIDYIIWYSKYDSLNHIINLCSTQIIGNKKIKNIPKKIRIEMLEKYYNIYLNGGTNIDIVAKHGLFFKYNLNKKEIEKYVVKNVHKSKFLTDFLTKKLSSDLDNKIKKYLRIKNI